MNFSPALDEHYLFEKHNIKSISYELTEVVRQKAGSGVMHNSIELRNSLKKGVFNQLTIDLDYPDLAQVSHQNLMDNYLESCGGKINGESIVIAYSNADVTAYNREIRKHFFPNSREVSVGDKVMVITNSNAYGFFISNGDFGLIKKVSNAVERRSITLKRKNKTTDEIEETIISLSFREVFIGFKDLDDKSHFFNATILEDLLYSEHAGPTSDENKALYLDFCIRHPQLKRGTQEFSETLKSDPYFNALRLKFGYAITCHKAQGSEWNHVFVKCKTHQNQLSADYFRWLYTAITRTTNKLYLLDPPTIKIGGGIKIVSTPNPPAIPTLYPPYRGEKPSDDPKTSAKQDSTEETFGIPANAHFSLEILRRIRELIGESDIKIHDVTQGQYQEIYFFEQGNEIARVDISYNGKGKISRIFTPRLTELSLKMVDLISPLNGVIVIPAIPNQTASFKFSEDFLNEFHQRLLSLAEQKEITISNVESMQWNQRYTFIQFGQSAVFDIFYNGKKQFTKCVSVRNACTSDNLSAEVEVILTKGLSS